MLRMLFLGCLELPALSISTYFLTSRRIWLYDLVDMLWIAACNLSAFKLFPHLHNSAKHHVTELQHMQAGSIRSASTANTWAVLWWATVGMAPPEA